MSHEFDETGVEQDTRRDGIENTTDDVGRHAVTVVSRPDAETDGHTDGGHDGVQGRSEVRSPLPVLREVEDRETGTETETLEHLVEDDDDEEDREIRVGREGQTDNDTAVSLIVLFCTQPNKRKVERRSPVQDNTKLEDSHSDELRGCLSTTRRLVDIVTRFRLFEVRLVVSER